MARAQFRNETGLWQDGSAMHCRHEFVGEPYRGFSSLFPDRYSPRREY